MREYMLFPTGWFLNSCTIGLPKDLWLPRDDVTEELGVISPVFPLSTALSDGSLQILMSWVKICIGTFTQWSNHVAFKFRALFCISLE